MASPLSRRRRWQELRHLPGLVPLRIKLITAVLALVIVALVAISVAGISFLRSYLIGQTDAALRIEVQGYAANQVQRCFLAPVFCPSPGQLGVAVDWVPAGGALQHISLPTRQLAPGTAQTEPGPAVGPKLRWLLANPGRPITVPAESGDGSWRVVAYSEQVPTANGFFASGTVIMGYDIASIDHTIARLTRIDLLVSVVVVAALAIAGVAIVRTSLRPLTDIEHTAQQIASGDLSQRVPEADPRTEVGRLGRALNAMLAQIEAAFQARAQSEAAARRSEERMRQFVADASHELRTPITVIRGYAEYYRQRASANRPPGRATPQGGPAPASGAGPGDGASSVPPLDLDRIMERVEQESARMGGLVEDLLLLARLDQQRPVERRPVDLLTLAADAVQDARAIAPGRTIELAVGTGTAFIVLGDEARLRQVISNLMSNALIHTPDGTPVEVRLLPGPPLGQPPVPGVTLEVADHGPGLSPEQAGRVFERFYRADQARTRASGGTGLGLAIVAALVAAHGGTVGVDPGPGRGATFRITLPLAPEAHGEPTSRGTLAAGAGESHLPRAEMAPGLGSRTGWRPGRDHAQPGRDHAQPGRDHAPPRGDPAVAGAHWRPAGTTWASWAAKPRTAGKIRSSTCAICSGLPP